MAQETDKPRKFKDITKELLSNWRKTKGKLQEITIPLDDDVDGEVAKFIICKPTKNLLPAITEYGKQENVEGLHNLFITNCVLGGDMDYIDGDTVELDVFLAVMEEVGKLLKAKRVTSKRI